MTAQKINVCSCHLAFCAICIYRGHHGDCYPPLPAPRQGTGCCGTRGWQANSAQQAPRSREHAPRPAHPHTTSPETTPPRALVRPTPCPSRALMPVRPVPWSPVRPVPWSAPHSARRRACFPAPRRVHTVLGAPCLGFPHHPPPWHDVVLIPRHHDPCTSTTSGLFQKL